MTHALPSHPSWRSLLFIPADNARFIERAHTRGADALILDLEDAVAPASKSVARDALAASVARLTERHATVTVRINSDATLRREDLSAAVIPGVSALVIPKVEHAEDVTFLTSEIACMEQDRRLPLGEISIIAMIESPYAVLQAPLIAAVERVAALAFGSEDFALALGVEPSPAALTLPCQLVALAARAHGRMAIGMPSSLAQYRDVDSVHAAAQVANSIGMTGALCIHPKQVPIVNRAFAPAANQIDWARKVMLAWQQAQVTNGGVCSVEGFMVDRPVVERALALLKRAEVELPEPTPP